MSPAGMIGRGIVMTGLSEVKNDRELFLMSRLRIAISMLAIVSRMNGVLDPGKPRNHTGTPVLHQIRLVKVLSRDAE